MKSSIDLGLAISALHSQKGVPRTADDIAEYCGCSRQRIEQIEKRALRKIRYKLHCDQQLQEALKEGIL